MKSARVAVAGVLVALVAVVFEAGPVSAAEVARTSGMDSRCTVEVINSTTADVRCYFDPATDWNAQPRWPSYYGTDPVNDKGTGTYLAGPAAPTTGASGYRYVAWAPNGSVTFNSPSTISAFGFGPAAGLERGQFMTRFVMNGGHGLVPGSPVSILARTLSSSCSGSGSSCNDLRTVPDSVPVYAFGEAPWPSDHFPGGTAVYVPPSNPCVDPGEVVFEVDGTDLSSGSLITTSLSPLAENFAAVSLATDEWASRAPGDGLAYRIGTTVAWTSIAGDGVPVLDVTVVATELAVPSTIAIQQIEFRCTYDGVVTFWALDGVGNQSWNETPKDRRVCTGLSVTRGSTAFAVGDLVQLAFNHLPGNYLGAPDGVAALEVFVGSGITTGDGGRQVVAAAYNLYGSQIGGSGAPYSVLIPTGSKGYVEFVAEFSGNTSTLFVQCEDNYGLYNVAGGGLDWTPSPYSDDNALLLRPYGWLSPSECLPFSGIGASPSSWLPGMGSMFVCITEALFRPGEWNAAEWDSRISATTLSDWGEPFAALTGGLAGLATADGDCAPTYTMPAPIPALTLDMCDGVVATLRSVSFTLSTFLIGIWVVRMGFKRMESFVGPVMRS